MILPVILSGGVGVRLWPLSQQDKPKQFLPLFNEKSLLQETVARITDLEEVDTPIFVCNEQHRFLLSAQLQEIGIQGASIILEPMGRNTAPAIVVAAMQAMASGQDPILLVLPSDHLIPNEEMFRAAITAAIPYAENNELITFGIVPQSPETGYGYIQAGKQLGQQNNQNIYAVKQFVEKPDLERAKLYLQSKDYYWNGGIFMFKASSFLNEMQKYAADILVNCSQALAKSVTDLDFIRLDSEGFAACRSESIDYAIMEKTKNAVIISLDAGWSDVGSWDALFKVSKKDDANNFKSGNVVVENVTGSYLRAEKRALAVIGVKDLVVVETKDAVLVAHKSESQKVKNILEKMKKTI